MGMLTIQIEIEDRALTDLERLEDFLFETDDPLAGDLHIYLMEALLVLTHQPGIGRPVDDGLRELIIDRGRGGYLARYQYQKARGLVTILRIRHQRESGYTAEEL
jgi:plasmid stabilization system protein ParE